MLGSITSFESHDRSVIRYLLRNYLIILSH